jgi:hypothetical protein
MILHDVQFPVIVRSDTPCTLLKHLRTALVAYRLRLRSLDYVRRRYSTLPRKFTVPPLAAVQRYQEGSSLVRDYVHQYRDIVRLAAVRSPGPGRDFACHALVRLDASVSASLVLFRGGFYYEASAVARLILEQLAWSATVSDLQDIPVIEKTRPHAAIGVLKPFLPNACWPLVRPS